MIALKMQDVIFISCKSFPLVCLFVWSLSSHSRIFHSYGDVICIIILFALSFNMYQHITKMNVGSAKVKLRIVLRLCFTRICQYSNGIRVATRHERFIHGQKRRSCISTEYLIRISLETCS